MGQVKNYQKNEASEPGNPHSLPIVLQLQEVGLTTIFLNNITPSDQIFVTVKAGATKLSGNSPTELTYRIRRGGVDGIEVSKRTRVIPAVREYRTVMFTHLESGLAVPAQQYTLTVQITIGSSAEIAICNIVSMSGVVYGV